MGYTIAQKIIKNHLVCGEMVAGKEIGLRIDQTLTQDATGTMAGNLREPLWWPQERPVPMRVARGLLGIPLPPMPGHGTLCGVCAGS